MDFDSSRDALTGEEEPPCCNNMLCHCRGPRLAQVKSRVVTRIGRRAFPTFLLAALLALFAVLSAMPWSAHAQAVPTLQIEDVSASEDAGRLKFKVSLADGAPAAQVVTVDYATSDGDALAGNDYAGTSGTLTIPRGDTFSFIFVAVHDDRVPEIDETFTLTLSNPSNAALPGGASSVAATGTILDNERPMVFINARQDEVFEGQTVFFDISRLGSAERTISVSMQWNYRKLIGIRSNQEKKLADALLPYSVVYPIPAGERGFEWSFRPDDFLDEDFLMNVRFASASSGVDMGPPVVVTVRQRPVHQSSDPSAPDDALPAVTIAAGAGGEGGVPTVAEGEQATFTLTRGGDTSETLTAWVHTEEPHHPDWTPGDDENPSAEFHNVTFTAGSDTATLTVDVEDDGVAESGDWLEAHVSPIDVSLFRRGDPHRAVVNIVDDRVDHDGLGGLREIGIVAITSAVDEGDQIRVNTVQPEVEYSSAPYDPLNVKVLISQDGSSVPEGRLGITASIHTKVAAIEGLNQLGIPTLTNDGDEPDTTVTFTLLESPHYTIDQDNASITVTVRDLDPAPVLEIADTTAQGGVDSIDFQVSFADDVPSRRDVSVDYHTQDGTATAGQDYSSTKGTLTIPAGETGGVITVPLLPETAEGRDETFNLQLGDPVNAALSGGGDSISATGTVDYRPEIRMTALDDEVIEGDAARFELTRTGAASSELTVRVNTREPNSPLATFGSNPTELDRTVTFLAGASTAILAVDTVQDNTDEGSDNFLQAELLEASDGEYKRKTTGPVFVKIFDTIPDVTVAAGQDTVVEDDLEDGESKDAVFTLTRGGDASEELTVTVRVDDPEMIRCFDHVYWRSFCRDGPTYEEEVTFEADSATATLAVAIYNDWRDVPDGAAVTVTVIDKNGYRPGDPDSARVTLEDNDFASILYVIPESAAVTLADGGLASYLSGSRDTKEVAEGEKVTFTIWRNDSESDIDAYEERIPWHINTTRPGVSSVEDHDVTLMEPGDWYLEIDVDAPEDNDKAERDWTYTFTIERIEKNNLREPLELEVENAQYFTVFWDRSVTVRVRDAGGPRVTIAADQTGITEGETAAFTLTRPGDTSEALAVRVSVEDPSNFMRGNHIWADPQPPTTVEFAAGSATATLSLPTSDDWRDIPDDDLTVTIEPGDNDIYRPGDTSSASVTVLDNDTKPVFELSVNEETLTEGETVVFTVTRTVDFTHEVSVVVYAGLQGQQRSRWLAFPAGKTMETVQFATEDDDLDEADVVYEIRVANRDTDYRTVAAPHTLAATVVDDDLPRVGIEALSDSYEEGDYARFRLTREGQTNSDLPVRVRLTQTGRVINYFPEYTFGERTLSIWETTSSRDDGFRIGKGDGDEEDGAVALELLPSEDYVIDPDKAADSFTVIDTDPPPTLLAFAPPVAEGDGNIRLVVSFDERPPRRDEKVTVDYSIVSGTATEGEDYTVVSGTLTFEPGEEPLYISVPVIQDSLPEPDETFFLVLSNARNARLPSRSRSTTVTIKDDEPFVIVTAANGEITEGETASFDVNRYGDTTEELSVLVSLLVGRPDSDLAELLDHSVTIPAGKTSVQLDHDTEDDDLDAPPFTIIAIVRDPADFNLPSTYLPPVNSALITVLDNDVATVTLRAANQTKQFGSVRFNLTREGDPSDPLTVSLDITQTGVLDDEEPLPDTASFATGPSTATFEAGSSTTNLRLTTTGNFSQGGHSFSMDRAWVHVALAGSDDYITGDPASASTLVVKDFADFPYVYIDDAGTVVEGGDLVFTLHRTGEAEGSLTAQLQMRVRKFASFIPYSYHEVTFEPGSLTTTFTVPTQDNELNDGNRQYRINLVLDTLLPDGPDVHSIYWGYQIGSTYEHRYPPVGEGWVRDDDIPTVWVTPETGEHLEDPEGGGPQFTVHRDSYTSTWSYVFTSTRQLRRWPPPIPDSLYTNTGVPKQADDSFSLLPGESSFTRNFAPRFVGPLGGESAVFIVPNYCGEDVLADCYTFPQYHIGTPSSGVIQVYNRFAGIMVEPVEAEVEEGEAAVFRLTRIGGTPVSNDLPLTVWIEVTQDGEYIEGMPPQTVKFRGWPETAVDEADKTITLSIPTTDDDDDERHGAITLRVLPPETIDVDEPSSYEVGVEQLLIPFETGTVRVTDNDYYPPAMSISDARAGEADGSMEFFVTVAPNEREMTVDWNTVAESGVGVATAGTDYDAASGTLTFAVGETIKKITVDVLDDEFNETEETFKVALSATSMVNAVAGDNEGIGVIEDDDEGTVVTIYPRGPYGGTEEGQPAEFLLQRVGGTGAMYVELEISQEGEFLWSLQPAKILTQIPAGVNEVTVAIDTIDDSAVEANGSVTATIRALYYYSPGKPDTATVRLRDNDRILSISDAEAGEGQGSMTFTVTMSAVAENRVRVEVFTVPGKATSDANITETSLGRDFEAKTEFLVFEPGETGKTFTVTLVDDDIDESKEDFTVMLFRPTSNVWVTDASATGSIEDNDDPMEVRIVREVRRVDENQGSAVLFAVELVHADTLGSERDTKLFWEVKPGAAAQDAATQDEDYAKPYSQQRGTLDIPIGHLTATLEVDLIDDDLLEPEFETFTVELVEGRRLVLPANENRRKVQISIRDDERLTAAITPVTDSVIEGDDAVFEVRLSGGVTTEQTVLEYTVAGTATSGDDYTVPDDYTATGGTLTIAAGSDTGTITIPVLVDSALDPDETVEVTLVSGASGSRKARIPDPIAAVTIVESGTMTVSVASAEAEEGGTLSFAVTLSLASQDDVTVDWGTADDPGAGAAATAGVDYTAGGGTLTVPAGLTSAVITVATNEDALAAEGDETFRVNLTRARSSALDDLPLGASTAIGRIWDNDIAPTGMTLTAAPDRVGEDAGAMAITVTATLDGQRSLARDTRVELALEDGSAAADDDYEPATAVLTIPAGRMSASATLTLAPVDDTVWEGNETVTIAGTAGDLSVTPAEVTITDDDAAPTGVTLTLAPAVIGEAAGETDLTVTATLTGGDSRIVDTEIELSVEGVSLTPDDGNGSTTAATGDDFTYVAVTLTIPAGRTSGSATLAFTPEDDTMVEDDETAEVTGTAEGLTVTAAGLTIEDDDQEPTRIGLSVSPAEVKEGDGATTLTVTATLEGGGSRTSATAVSLTVEGVTATAGADFTAQTGVTLTIPAGQLSHTAELTLTPVDDNLAEGKEELSIGGSNAEPGLPVDGVRVDLNDNDAEPTKITLSLNKNYVEENRGSQWLTVTAALEGNSRRTVDTSVRLRVDGGTATTADYWALAGDLVIEAGEREGTADIVLAPTDDHIDEDDETLEVWGSTTRSRSAAPLQVSREQVTIRDDDVAGVTVTPTEVSVVEGQSGSYRVVLDSQPTGEVTITVAGHADTDITLSGDTLTDDALTFTSANWNIAQAVTVTAAHDDDTTDPPDITLTHTVSGGDYEGLNADDVVVSITEDDETGVTISESALSIDEGDSATYTVVLDTKPTADVTVAIAGHADTDITLSGETLTNDTLTFTSDNWNTAQTLTVTAASDDDAASDDAVTLTHMVTGTGEYTTVTADSVIVTIGETDKAGVTILETALSIEEGGSDTYTVVLDTQPTANVTVAIAGHADTDITLSGETLTNDTLTFTAATWDTAQTLTVTAASDDDAASDAAVTLTHTVTGTAEYAGVTAGSVTVTIVEKDASVLSVSDAEAAEDGGNVVFTVNISAASGEEVTVAYATSDVTATQGQDYTETTGTLTFAANSVASKTISVLVTDDAVDEEEEETFTLTLSNVQGAALSGGSETLAVTGTITDDDDPAVTASFGQASYSVAEGSTVEVTVTLSADPEREVTVNLTKTDQGGVTGSDYSGVPESLVFQGGDTEKSFTFSATADDIDDDGESVALGFGTLPDDVSAGTTATVTITDDDTAGVTVSETALSIAEGGSDTYTVKLDTEPTADVTVAIAGHANTDITLSGDTLTNNALTFTAENWETAQTVTVAATADDDAASDTAVTLTHTANGGGYVDIQETVTVTIVEKDASVLSVGDAEAAEDGGNVVFTVSISAASGEEVTVAYATSNGTATAGEDYTSTTGTLTFADNSVVGQTISVPVTDDTVDEEEEETFTLTLSNAQGASLTGGGSTLAVTGTITDDDDPAVTASFEQSTYSVAEGSTVEVTVTLSADPEREVTVLLTHDPRGGVSDADYSGVPESVVFQIGDTEKSFTFTATADDIDDDGESVALGFGTMPDDVTAGTTATVTITDDDTAGVTVSETALSIAEGGSDTYMVKLDTKPTADVTVAIAGHADTDITLSGETLTDDTLTFTSDNWDTAQTVTATAGEDDDAASDAAVTLTHTVTGTAEYAGVTAGSVTVTIVEKDASVLSVSDAEAAEDDGNVVFTVNISAASDEEVTVAYATSDVTATQGQDYTETTGTLTFAANSVASQTISVLVTDDAVDEEEEETFTLTLSNVQGASLSGGSETLAVTGTITDDDEPAVTASFGQASYSVAEGSTVEVTVTLSADPEREVTVNLTKTDQGGVTGSDYSGVPESLVFQGGDTEKSFTFSATADDIDDDGESVALGFGTLPDDVSAGTTATVTITDDDTAGVTVSETALSIAEGGSDTYTVKLDTEPTADVTVAIAGHASTDISLTGDTLTNDTLTFTSENWNTAQTVTVTAAQDDDAASDDAVTLTHTVTGTGEYAGVTAGSVTVAIVEKDASVLSVGDAEAAEDGGNVVFTVSISAAAGEEVTVEYVTSNGTATAGQDYTETTGTLTFAASSVASQTISVLVTDDAVDEEEEETFTLTLSNVQGASLSGGGSTLAVTGTITDDDDPAVTASFKQSAYSVAEGSTVEVTVTLSADPEREVTVLLTHDPRGGVSDADYSGVPESVVFQIGDTEKSFTFTATADDIDDDGESVALGFGTMPDDVTAGTTATVTITDDDTAGVTVSETALSIAEGGSDTYMVKLDTKPTADVTVAVAGHSGTDITLTGATLTDDTLTFTSDNWDTAQTVTATAGEDDDAASDAAVTLTHTVTGTAEYAGVTAGSVTVTIVEKDASVLSVSDAEAAEDDGNVVFTVNISAASDEEVTVAYATSDVTATQGQDYTETTGTLTFAANSVASKTISVLVTDDAVDEEEEETFTLTLSNVQGASLSGGGSTLAVTGTITDDDDPAVTASFKQANYSVVEGSTVEVTVTLSADPEREVTVLLTHDPQGNTGSGDYSGVPGSVVFQIGDTEKSFTFTAADDDIDDDGESVALGFGTLPERVSAGTTATVTITDDDTAGVTVSETALSIAEGGSDTYTVVLDTQPSSSVTVTIAGHASTDISLTGDTLTNDTLTFTSENWNTAQTVTVTAAQDDDAASDDAVTLTHTVTGTGEYAGATAGSVRVTIVEKDASVLSVGDAEAAEDGGNVVFTVNISAASDEEVTVAYATSDVTATQGQDYTETTGTLTFAANSVASKTISVLVTDDTVDEEEEETFTLTLSNVQGASLSGGGSTLAVTGTITDDDDPAVTASFKQSAYSVAEGSTVEVTVTLSADPEREVTVNLTKTDQGGVTGSDYSGVPGSLVFQIGDTEKSFTFTATADDIDDDGESVALGFGTLPDGVSDGTTATVSITDDDTAGVTVSETALSIDEGGSATYTVVLDSEPTANVTVAIAGHSGTDISLTGNTLTNNTLTFTAATWNTAQTVTVTAAQDDDAASDDAVTLTHTVTGTGEYAGVTAGSVTVTIVEKDASVLSVGDAEAAEDGGNVVFTVSISAASGQEVTVAYATSDVTATQGQDYTSTTGTLTFAASSVASQTISVPVADDAVDEEEEETFTLTLSNVQGASLSGGASTLAATGTITDDDDPAVTASFKQSAYSVAEGSTVEVTVTLSADPEREVTVLLTHDPQGDTSSGDYSGVPGSLVFQIGDTEKSFTFSAAADDIDDDGESVALGFGTMPERVSAGTTATVTITDDDTAGVTVSESALSIAEGGSDTYTVVLDTQPTSSVTVTIAGHASTDITLSGDTLTNNALTFTAENWDTAQTVTVSAGEDDDTNADPAVTLTHTVAGGDYEGLNAAGVTVSVTENDQDTPPGVTVSFEKDYHNLAEGASGVGVGLLLSAALESDVTIPIVVLPESTAGAEDYSGVPNGITFAAGETYAYFWVYPVADAVVEEDEQVWLGLDSLPDGVSAGSNSRTYVRIIDSVHVSFGSSSYSATEGEADAVVTVRLNKPLPDGETIPLTAEGGSGATSDDWSGVPDELYFAAGETEQTFTVTAVDDTVEDDGEMVTLGFGTLSDRLIAVSPATATITLMNIEERTSAGLPACSDSPSMVVGTVYSGNIEAAGRTEWFNFYLEPYRSHVIEIRGVDTGDGTLEDPALLQWRAAVRLYHVTLPAPSPASGNRNVERTVWVSLPGVYCFEVASGDNGTGTYRLELRVNQDRMSGGGPDGYGGHDVPADTSTRITTRLDIEGMYGYLGDDGAPGDDEDWFRIDLTGGVEYQIDLEPLTYDLVHEVVDGRRQERRIPIDERHWLTRPRIAGVHDANGAVIEDTASAGEDMEVSVDFTPPADGAYYIAVGSNSGDRTGLFQLCVKEKGSSGTNRCNPDAPPQQGSSPQRDEAENSPATGGPGISGTPRVGKTLTATTQGMSDEDGLTRAIFSYQWVRHDFGTGTDTDIGGATGASYTVAPADTGQAIKVRVGFTDDAGHEESLTSYAVAVLAQPLTAELPESPFQSPSHTGANDRPQVIVAFNRAVPSIAETTPSVLVTGGTVSNVRAHEEDGLEHAWVFFLDPAGTDDIHFTLISGRSCEAGGICAADGTTLSDAPATRTIPGPEEETEPQQQQRELEEPPAKPTGLSSEVSHNMVTLTWNDPNDDSITGYLILRGDKDIHEEGTFLTVAPDTGSSETTYVDASVEPERRYVYRIKAIYASGVSETSSWVRAYTPAVPDPAPEAPSKPTGLSATFSHDSVTLTWDDPGDDSITGYVILRRDKDLQPEEGTFFTVTSDTGFAETTFTDDTAEPDKRYVYRIKAINEHGEISEISSWVRAYTPAAP